MRRGEPKSGMRGAWFIGAVLLAAAPAFAQRHISNAKIDTRQAVQSLEREVLAIASRGSAAWVGFRSPIIDGEHQLCCSDFVANGRTCCGTCRLEASGVSMTTRDSQSATTSRVMLEPPSEFLVLARVEAGAVQRIRTFSVDCAVDAGGMPLVWLENVQPDDSVAWLAGLVTNAASMGDQHARVAKPAIAAIALTRAAAADHTLESFVAPEKPEWLRGDTAFWLGSARGDAGARLLARMMSADPSDTVREKVAFALSVSRTPVALTTLLAAARDDRSPRVRGQALFWLAHKAGDQAVAAITHAITNDPETEVKKRAVFALSQLPKDEGVPKLIEVARTNRNPEVRKQAFFWLGQSRDPRAVQFFEEILLTK